MGARGRTPKPAELVNLEDRRGTKAHREKTGGEVPVAVLPILPLEAPEGRLFKAVKAEDFYNELAQSLHGAGVLRETDRTLMIMVAEAVERLSKVTEQVRGVEVAQIAGQIQIHPYYVVMQKERQFIFQSLRELGLTPSARSRVMRDVAIGQLAAQQARRFEF